MSASLWTSMMACAVALLAGVPSADLAVELAASDRVAPVPDKTKPLEETLAAKPTSTLPPASSAQHPIPQEECPKCLQGPLMCSDGSQPKALGPPVTTECCQWKCPPGAETCYSWGDPPRKPCEDGTKPVRAGCSTFTCAGKEVEGGPVMVAGRIYMPGANTSVRSTAALGGYSELGQQRQGQGFAERLLGAALEGLGLKEEPTWPRSSLNLDLQAPALLSEARQAAEHMFWSEQARDEHASVAAFALLQLELLAHGAPLELVSRTLTASQEELLHVRACEALAGVRQALALPEHELRAPLRQDWPRLFKHSLTKGALPEGTAAVKLWRQSHGELLAGRPSRAELLWAMGHEEARHAELAHDIAAWAAAAHGVEVPALRVGLEGVSLERSGDGVMEI